MNEAERGEEGYFYIQVFWDCGVVVTCYPKKKKNVLSFLGMELPSLYYIDRLSFLPSPDQITLFARGETLFCFLIT